MCKRNTDVAASIAGYYYQILLACREITSNQGNIQAVGIEAGADIRLLLINNDKVSIEAKFHKEKMTKYCDDIVKTVYNFYVSSYSDRQLVFSTNVAAGSTSAKFFSKWDTDLALDEKVKFVKECILRKSIEVTGIYKMNYNKYLESYTGSEKEKIKSLIEKVFLDEDNGFNYEDYAYVNSNVNYEDFVKKLHFSFNDKSKLDMIYEIKENIISNITRECTQIGISVDDNNANKILNLIMDKFYISTVENSNTETMSSIETMNKISKSDFIEILRCYETEEITYINNLDIHRCIKTLENEERNFVKSVINSYCGAYREKLLATYKEIEREIINILGTSETYKQLIEPFLFKQYEDISFEDISSLFKIINQLTLLAVFNEVDTKKIELVNEKESVDNIELKELIRYCFKYSASSAYRKTQSIISPLIREYKDNPQLNENQIFVLNLDFKRNGKPCESKLNPDLVDITQTEENLKDFKLFQGMCYKCTACLDLESEDASTKENIENFLDCGRS